MYKKWSSFSRFNLRFCLTSPRNQAIDDQHYTWHINYIECFPNAVVEKYDTVVPQANTTI